MLESIAGAPPDPILGLNEAFRGDARSDKVNLTTGVYQDESGTTPILQSVKRAEQVLIESEGSKGYLGIDGLHEFKERVYELAFGQLIPQERVAVFQVPGGTGGLRVVADFIANNLPAARVWLTTPTWPNHPAIFKAAGVETRSFPYLSEDRRSLDFASLLDTLQRDSKAGDVICLHACCHNPAGIDPTDEQWAELARITAERGVLPLIDFAYQGFGDGLEQDLRGVAAMVGQHEELLICTSYSKNFGLYSERTGALFAVCASPAEKANVTSSVKSTIRSNYSNPPRHGAAIVATVLGDNQLRSLWRDELATMRGRIHQMRTEFVQRMADENCDTDFSFLLSQRGMFSFSGLNPMQVDWLRNEKGIYIVGSGRINVAGITPSNMEYLTSSIAEALRI